MNSRMVGYMRVGRGRVGEDDGKGEGMGRLLGLSMDGR